MTRATLRQLFWSFFKIGTFTLGGGYAMIPLMEKELVEKHKWLNNSEFMDVITLSQAMPGVFAVNLATVVGNKVRGLSGAVASVVGNIMMPIIIILALAGSLHYLQGNEIIESVFKGIRPVVVALITATVFKMAKTAKINKYNFWIPIIVVLLVWFLAVSPIWIILIAGIGGFLFAKFFERKEDL